MAYSLPEQVALAYTSLGSQRAVARDLGLSHQQVGRLLRAAQGYGPELGGLAKGSRALQRPEVVQAIESGFARHIDRARAQAKADGLPFRQEVPIAYRRLPMPLTERRKVFDPKTGTISTVPVKLGERVDPETGEIQLVEAKGRIKPLMIPGERVAAEHTGWVPQKIKEKWVTALQRTDKFANASVSSLVNLRRYMKQADDRFKAMQAADPNHKRTEDQERFRRNMRKILREGDTEKAERVFAAYVPMDAGYPPSLMRENLRAGLMKQAGAVAEGAQGAVADQVLLQTRRRAGEKSPSENALKRMTGKGKSSGRKAEKGGGKGRAR